jgi:hypothetical protein
MTPPTPARPPARDGRAGGGRPAVSGKSQAEWAQVPQVQSSHVHVSHEHPSGQLSHVHGDSGLALIGSIGAA